LNEELMKTPVNVEEHLKRTLTYQRVEQHNEEEEELERLLKQCEEIEKRRQKEGERSSGHSGIGRYSSIII
jgi:hypothetical protein